MRKGTVAELVIYLLENYEPLATVEVVDLRIETVQTIRVTTAKGGENKKVVGKEVYKVEKLSDPADAEKGDLVYLDYSNNMDGPATRVGFVVSNDWGSILIYDWSVDGFRRFDHDYIDDIHRLS